MARVGAANGNISPTPARGWSMIRAVVDPGWDEGWMTTGTGGLAGPYVSSLPRYYRSDNYYMGR